VGSHRGGGVSSQQQQQWRCPVASCGNMNYEWRRVCNRCALPRPPDTSSPQAGSEEFS
jgi:hypothetical protein